MILKDVVKRAEVMLAPHIKLLGTTTYGLEDRIHLMECKLSLGQHHIQSDCLLAGVYGMGGIGKTTLALALYDKAANHFKGRRIYLAVGDQCKDEVDLRDKRRELLQLLADSSTQPSSLSSPAERQLLSTALRSSGPLLLVLDDLWTRDQLHWLLACEDSENPQKAISKLPPGSRVLLTSRYRSIVTVEGYEEHVILLTELKDQFSAQMLSETAFGPSALPPEFTPSHLKQALDLCGGLPLALRVLGGQLKLAKARNGDGWQVHPATSHAVSVMNPLARNRQLCLKTHFSTIRLLSTRTSAVGEFWIVHSF